VSADAVIAAGATKSVYAATSAGWTDTLTVGSVDPSMNGQGATLRITYHVNGTQTWNNIGGVGFYSEYEVTVDGNFMAQVGYNNGPIAPVSTLSSFVIDRPITLGATFDASMGAATYFNFTNSALFTASAHTNLTLSAGAMTVLDINGNAIAYTATTGAGTARSIHVTSGGTLAGFSLANNTANGHMGSIVSVQGGTASTDHMIAASFLAAPSKQAVKAVSDAVDFSGTGVDRFVLQIGFDEATVAAAGLTDLDLHMEWLDPSDGTYKDAYMGNSDGGANHQFFNAAYDAATMDQLGNYGVDTVNHTLWAVVDHNSQFVVGTAVPEPSAAVAVIAGFGIAIGRRRRQRT
jgi:hypothetical protein